MQSRGATLGMNIPAGRVGRTSSEMADQKMRRATRAKSSQKQQAHSRVPSAAARHDVALAYAFKNDTGAEPETDAGLGAHEKVVRGTVSPE